MSKNKKVETALQQAYLETRKPGFDVFDKRYEFYRILAKSGLIEDDDDRILDYMFYDPQAVIFALKCIHLSNESDKHE